MSDRITGRQAVCLMILFQFGSTLVTGGSIKAEQDSWITLLIGLILAVPVVLLYARLNTLCPGSDLFDMSYLAFGKVGGAIVTLLFTLYALHLGALVIRDLTEYIQVLSLPETPEPVCAICVGLLVCFAVRKGIGVCARSAEYVAPIAYGMIAILLGLTVKDVNLANLQPVFAHDPKLLLSDGFGSLTFPFAESVMLLSVFCTVKDSSTPFQKHYLRGLLFPGLVLIVIVVDNLAVLGPPIVKVLFYPAYQTASVINVGNFISRIEVLVSANFLIFGLAKITVCIYVGCRGLSRLFGQKHFKLFTVVATVGSAVESQLIYKNTMQMFAALNVYKYYAPFFEIVLPLAVLLTLKIKKTAAAPKVPETQVPEGNAPQQ